MREFPFDLLVNSMFYLLERLAELDFLVSSSQLSTRDVGAAQRQGGRPWSTSITVIKAKTQK